MLKIGQLTIRQKLMMVSLVSLASLALVGISGWLGVSRVGSALDEIQGRSFPAVTSMLQARSDQMETVLIMREFAEWKHETYEDSPEDGLREGKALASSVLLRQAEPSKRMENSFSAYDALPKTPEEESQWAIVKEKKAAIDDAQNEIRTVLESIVKANDFAVARSQSSRFFARNNTIEQLLTDSNKETQTLLEIIGKNADEIKSSAESSRAGALTVIVAIFVLAGAGLGGLNFLIGRTVVGSLEAMRREFLRIADTKDFTSRVKLEGKNELSHTANAFNGLLDTLQASLRAVLESALGISKAANDSAIAASRVLEASNQQSEAASSMAAAIEEMTVGISHISANARAVMGRSQDASKAADTGAKTITSVATEMDIINQTVSIASHTINEVNEQSSRISTIMRVIKDVADQTNLLALNAAIEAARAGEQGRGFAVVADEVRKLAERTTHSADEISSMIKAMQSSAGNAVAGMQLIVEKVEGGKDRSSKAATTIVTIQANSDEMAQSINEISNALAEQSSSAHEISRKVELVAQMSEGNCAVASETSHLADDLKSLSERLRTVASLFRV